MILLKNGLVYLTEKKRFEKNDILIKDKKIEKIAKNIENEKAEIIDCDRKIVFPGFIDIHCHLRDPGATSKEDIESGAMSAAKGGFTSVCCMPNTNPVIDNISTINYVSRKAKDVNKTKIFVIGAMSKGLKGEEIANIGSMVKGGVVAVSDDGNCIQNTNLALNVMRYASTFDIPIIIHPEDYSLSGNGQINYGYMSAKLGLEGIPSLSEEMIVSREIMLADVTNSHVHIAHLSTRRSVELVRRAKADGINVTAEVTPHHLILTEKACENYDTNTKMKPPLRREEDRKALIEGLLDGTIDAIATDHAPHTDYQKELEFPRAPFGVIGFESAFPVIYTNLVKTGVLSKEQLIEKMVTNPAKIINKELGKIAEDQTADLTVVDTDKPFDFTKKEIRSKSKNSPFLGERFYGKVIMTICDGKFTWKE